MDTFIESDTYFARVDAQPAQVILLKQGTFLAVPNDVKPALFKERRQAVAFVKSQYPDWEDPEEEKEEKL